METTTTETTTEMQCPICWESTNGNTNYLITECGHRFHTSCMMKNIQKNGFQCPYCRSNMVQSPPVPTIHIIPDEEEETIPEETIPNIPNMMESFERNLLINLYINSLLDQRND